MTQIIVSSGTTFVSTTIPVNSTYIVEGSGTLDIVNGGTVSGLITVSSGGIAILESGGSVVHGNTTVSSGGTFEFVGLNASGFGVSATSGATVELGPGAYRNTPYTLSGGVTGIVLSGGADFGLTVLSGATGIVESGGTASGYTVSAGGIAILQAGGVVSGATVSSGGTDFVSGIASNTVVGSGRIAISPPAEQLLPPLSRVVERSNCSAGQSRSSDGHQFRRHFGARLGLRLECLGGANVEWRDRRE